MSRHHLSLIWPAGLLLLGLCGHPAAAEEDLTAAVAMSIAATAEVPAAEAPAARVSIAVPVGSVMIGADEQPEGGQRYAARTATQGPGMVRFSALRPSIAPPATGSVDVPTGLPLVSARLTSSFGGRRNPVTGYLQNHGGIDLGAPAGTPVAATGTGVVSFAGFAGSYGLLVVVNHGNGLQTRYAHLSQLTVSRGQSINRGDIVGRVGSTGRSTGPHLHYEVRTQGQAIDPLSR